MDWYETVKAHLFFLLEVIERFQKSLMGREPSFNELDESEPENEVVLILNEMIE